MDDVNDQEALATLAVSASLFDRRDREHLRNYVTFALGSVRRHRPLVLATLVVIVGATIASFFALPRTYHVETKALAEPASALTVRADGPSAESLTRVAADTVLRQENLLALIQETDLLRYTREHRAPAQRAKDAVLERVLGHEDSEAEQLDALVRRLEKKLVVWSNEGGNAAGGSTVTIAIDWPDASMACRLVDAALRAFLDARYAREVTALEESIAILNKHITSVKADVDEAVSGIERLRAPGDASRTSSPVTPPTPPRSPVLVMQRPATPPTPPPDAELQQLRLDMQAKTHAIDEMEEQRRRQLAELQARLADARVTLTESHPTIVNLKQSIAALSVDSAQLTSLRQEASSLKAQYDTRGANAPTAPTTVATWAPALAGASASATATPPQLPSDVLRIALDLREDRDPAMVYARGQLRDAMDKYAALRTQIQTAQIDLETAQAAFKYRYTVVTPARLPKSPAVPNIPVVLLVAFIAAMLCGLLFAVITDLRTGRLLEQWQLERALERPIVGEIALPAHLEMPRRP
jgi:uncharacterized protein involved in exopolysaccharide biosynthesis